MTQKVQESQVYKAKIYGPISRVLAYFDGVPLLIGAIFISTGSEIKSTENLKVCDLFHIKKTEEIRQTIKNFGDKSEKDVSEKF